MAIELTDPAVTERSIETVLGSDVLIGFAPGSNGDAATPLRIPLDIALSGAGATGGAGGVLSGSFPNPGFAVNMATQAELDGARDEMNLGAQIDNADEELDSDGNDVLVSGTSFGVMLETPSANDGDGGTTTRGLRKISLPTLVTALGVAGLARYDEVAPFFNKVPTLFQYITGNSDIVSSLPQPSNLDNGKIRTFKKVDDSSGTYTSTPFLATIDGISAGRKLFYQNDFITLQSDGANYTIIAWKINGAIPLNFAPTIVVDCALIPDGGTAKVTLTGNATLGAFINYRRGQRLTLSITQDGAGSRTLGYTPGAAGGQRFSTTIPSPTLTAAAGKTDKLTFLHDADADRFDLLEIVKGF